MAQRDDQESNINEETERLKNEIRQIRCELGHNIITLKSRLDVHRIMEQAVVYLASRAGIMVGTSVGLFRRLMKKVA